MVDISDTSGTCITAKLPPETVAKAEKWGVDTAHVLARVNFEMALKRVQGNHFSFDTLTFKECELTRDPAWMKQLIEALATNTTCTCLDLSNTMLNDSAVQMLCASLAVPSKCPKLKKLRLGGNPQVGNVGQTVAQGLAHLRKGLELDFGEGAEPAVSGFVHQKELVEGVTSWWNGDIAVEGQNRCFYCPKEVLAHAGVDPETKLELTQGFQGPNGVKYRCDYATFEIYNCTGNMVLLKLADKEGVEV